EKAYGWIQIRYVESEKTYFYLDKSEDTKLKSYLVKSDFVCVEKMEGEWAYCTYFGKKISKGWMKMKDFNTI
ncbi:MAG: hypothetical protein ACKVOU_06865, partial [Cytophagales bacterium]